MAFSRLLYVFVKIDIWISLNRYMDSFQLIYELEVFLTYNIQLGPTKTAEKPFYEAK